MNHLLDINPNTEAVKLQSKKRIKKYQFKGCKVTSDDSIIVNHACPEHHAVMKERNTENKIANVAKCKALLHKQFDFVSCCSLKKMLNLSNMILI